jgi:DNA repair protein RadC
MENISDHNLLELFISIIIPRCDVKQLSYDLINTFGSLENVINASPTALMQVKGVGESTAVEISLIKKIYDRTVKGRNRGVKQIKTLQDAQNYCINELCNESEEKVIQINLDNSGGIINKHDVGKGSVNCTNVDTGTVVGNALIDRASNVIIAHNHPHGSTNPSANDINFTINLNLILRKMNISLVEHFIVADNDCSFIINHPDYSDVVKNQK